MGIDVAGNAASDELGHVNTSIGRLAIVDPGLRLAETLSEFTLRQPGILLHGAARAFYTASPIRTAKARSLSNNSQASDAKWISRDFLAHS